jgi:hypothetical protein
MNENGIEQLMTPEEFARLRRTTRGVLAVERCRRKDHPPFIKLNRRVLYDRRAVLAWLAEHTVNPPAREVRE